MQKLMIKQVKSRISNKLFWIPTVTTVIWLTVLFKFGDQFLPRFSPPIYLPIVLFMTPSILLAIGAYGWFKGALELGLTTCCRSCNYDLQGHEEIPSLCPECGNNPSPLSEPKGDHKKARQLSLIPGVFLMLFSMFFALLTVLYLFLITNGGLS